MKGEKESVRLSIEEKRIGRAQTLRNESEEELLRVVYPYIIRIGVNRRKRGGREF